MAVIDSLAAYWSMEEASGARADAHASNNLTDNNTVTQGTGIVGDCAEFTSANSESLSIADNADLSLSTDTPFSLAFWTRTPGGSVQCSEMGLVWKSAEVSGVDYEYVVAHTTACAFVFRVSNNSATGAVTNGAIYTDATDWKFVVAWHDPTANKLFLQVNNGTPAEAAWSGGTYDGSATLYLGRQVSGSYFNGLLDEVGFWKKALTSDERTWLYNSGAGRSYADIVAEAGGGGGLAIPIVMHHLRQQGLA